MMPVFFTGGLTGAFLHPLAVSYGLAVIASLVVALTVTPALGLVLYSAAAARVGGARRRTPRRRGHHRRAPRLFRAPRPALIDARRLRRRRARGRCRSSTRRCARPSRTASSSSTGMPRPSTSLPEMHRITSRAAAEIRALPGVREVGGHVGRAITSDQVAGSGSGEMWVTMKGSADYGRTLAAIRGVVAGYPGRSQQRPHLRGRPDERRPRAGRQRPDRPHRTARTSVSSIARRRRCVAPWRRSTACATPASSRSPCSRRCRSRSTSRRPGGTTSSPATSGAPPRSSSQGLDVGAFFQEQKVFQVVVRGKPELRQSIDTVRNLRIDAPDGTQVRLGDVASVAVAPNPVDLRHDAVSRYVDVRAAVSGRGVDAVPRRRPRPAAGDAPPARLPRRGRHTLGRRAVAAVGLPRPRGGRGGRDLPAAPGRVRNLAPRLARVRDASDGAGRRPGGDRSPAAATCRSARRSA